METLGFLIYQGVSLRILHLIASRASLYSRLVVSDKKEKFSLFLASVGGGSLRFVMDDTIKLQVIILTPPKRNTSKSNIRTCFDQNRQSTSVYFWECATPYSPTRMVEERRDISSKRSLGIFVSRNE